ncbi:chitobiase/beta-hexosaminidase C-terminal domain-containing protein [Acidicapsa acidisoli]|uniref:chitobiase/beta-hexosaminidase C-terminal domain-containing protein n=1 Tax=Acidicapsa acidisoli TaxID=1615681 RepID=UPI0021E0AD35|nr:chitobiase/beta-hexosaminidase C-terminal domain-containing protein [Acidicapsa acidisoli]
MKIRSFLRLLLCVAGAFLSSAIATAAISTPSFSTGTGTYRVPPTVKISEGTSGTKIYYTTNGSTPTTSSAVYSEPLTIGSATAASTTTLKAIAVYPGGSASAVASATYTVYAALAPVLSVTSGSFDRSVAVSIKDGTSGAVIHYTTDGNTPSAASPVYSGPITFSNRSTFSSTATLKAIAVYPGGPPSSVTSGSYTILSEYIPVHNVNSNASFFGMNASGILNGTPWPLVPTGSFRIIGEETDWSTLNPASGTYNWKSLDQEIDLARGNNSQVLFTFVGTPPWAIATNLGISAISRSGGVVTVTTSEPHNLYYNSMYQPAQQTSVEISGVADSSFDGTFAITGTPTSTTLTYSQFGYDSTSSAGSLSAVCGTGVAPGGCTEAPVSLASWDAFVYALINHVGPRVIKYWELWNEANIADGWNGDPMMLVAMTKDARAIIKKADPNAIILSPSTTINFETPTECATRDPRCGSKWLSNWLAAGGKYYIDGVAFHGYPSVGEAPEQIQGVVTLQQVAMNQNGIGSLPIVDAESSWGLNTRLPDESDQVAFLGRHFLLEHSIGVQASFWYAYDSTSWGGLWTPFAGLNAVGDADREVAKWIEGVSLIHPCNATVTDSTTYTCSYTRPNGYSALAVWNTVGEKSFTVPAGLVQYRDLYGNVINVWGGSVEISTSPILLESFSAF